MKLDFEHTIAMTADFNQRRELLKHIDVIEGRRVLRSVTDKSTRLDTLVIANTSGAILSGRQFIDDDIFFIDGFCPELFAALASVQEHVRRGFTIGTIIESGISRTLYRIIDVTANQSFEESVFHLERIEDHASFHLTGHQLFNFKRTTFNRLCKRFLEVDASIRRGDLILFENKIIEHGPKAELMSEEDFQAFIDWNGYPPKTGRRKWVFVAPLAMKANRAEFESVRESLELAGYKHRESHHREDERDMIFLNWDGLDDEFSFASNVVHAEGNGPEVETFDSDLLFDAALQATTVFGGSLEPREGQTVILTAFEHRLPTVAKVTRVFADGQAVELTDRFGYVFPMTTEKFRSGCFALATAEQLVAWKWPTAGRCPIAMKMTIDQFDHVRQELISVGYTFNSTSWYETTLSSREKHTGTVYFTDGFFTFESGSIYDPALHGPRVGTFDLDLLMNCAIQRFDSFENGQIFHRRDDFAGDAPLDVKLSDMDEDYIYANDLRKNVDGKIVSKDFTEIYQLATAENLIAVAEDREKAVLLS